MSQVKKAVVLLSGGLDSATVLAIAKSQGYECYCLHKTVQLDLSLFGGSALTDNNIAVPEIESVGIPVTYVPARNTIMLSLSLAWAEVLEAQDIFIGVNALDYSGYPDCRGEYVKAFQSMANLATKSAVEGKTITVHAPLIDMTKAEIVKQGMALGVDYAMTVSCYQANAQGEACGLCDSCRLRKQGFEAAGLTDPTAYQSHAK